MEDAVATYEKIADHKGLAAALVRLGIAYSQTGNHSLSAERFERVVKMTEAPLESAVSDSLRAMALNGLGNSRFALGDSREALGCFEKARAYLRSVLAVRPDSTNRCRLAILLANIGRLHCEEERWSEAIEPLVEAVDLFDSLSSEERDANAIDHAWALDLLGSVEAGMGNRSRALRTSYRAIAVAEAAPLDSHALHLLKGRIRHSYCRVLVEKFNADDMEGVFSTLAALREGNACLTKGRRNVSIGAAFDTASKRARALGQSLVVLVVESISPDTVLFGMLRSAGNPRWSVAVADYHQIGEELLAAARSPKIREHQDCAQRETWRELGQRAWRLLPPEVQDVLRPSQGHDVLISGDGFWTSVPYLPI